MTAAVLAALGAASSVRAEQPQQASEALASQVAGIMGREQAAMTALGAGRIAKIAEDRRAVMSPAARPVAVAARAAPAKVAATVAARLDIAALDALPPATGDAQWQCLAAAIYFESRGEPLDGQIGVAEVVLNRVDSTRYPNTVCGVTTQGVGAGRGCQFSYACDGRSDAMRSAVPRARAERLARLMLDGRARGVTDGAMYFHATFVSPGWSRKFTQTAAIGQHVFYRQGTLVAAN